MRVVLFLVDTLFFILVAAAFLRAWMNHLRVQMQGQPGRFAIAVTDWLVKPVRRILPAALSRSRFDWGSAMAAVLFSLCYGGLWLAMVTGATSSAASPVAMLAGIATVAGTFLLRVLLQGLMILLFMYAILSWVQPGSPILGTLDRLVSPILNPVRKVVPTIGGVDLSVLLLLLLLQVALMLVGM